MADAMDTQDALAKLRESYRILFRTSLSRKEALEKVLAQFAGMAEVEHLAAFIEESKRGVHGQADPEE